MAGKAAVNRYTGQYTAGACGPDGIGSLSVGPVATTKMAGPEPAMRAEDAYLGLLAQARGYRLDCVALGLARRRRRKSARLRACDVWMKEQPHATVRSKAPAKVNLSLLVGSAGADGYHEVFSVFVPVELFDELVFELVARPSGEGPGTLRVECETAPGEDNLVARALRSLERATGWVSRDGSASPKRSPSEPDSEEVALTLLPRSERGPRR